MYQDGIVVQAGVPELSVTASSLGGRWRRLLIAS